MTASLPALAPVVVLAVGNPSRGDDALGPTLLARFAAWLEETGQTAHFELIEDFQLQVEHALDLEGRQLALFIDAAQGMDAPWAFSRLAPAAGFGPSTHALEPASVLHVFHHTLGRTPPPSFLLAVAGHSFELGDPLSAAAQENLAAAFALLVALAGQTDAAAWARRAVH